MVCVFSQAIGFGRESAMGTPAHVEKLPVRRRDVLPCGDSVLRSRSAAASGDGAHTPSTTSRSSPPGARVTRGGVCRLADRRLQLRHAGLAAPMDSVMSRTTAIALGRAGGLGVLDLEGLWTRYDDPEPLLARDRAAGRRRRRPADAGDLRRADQARADQLGASPRSAPRA
jgi:hypothetical protein